MTKEITKKTDESKSLANIKPSEIETIIVNLAKENKSPAQIGVILRDQYGVPKARLVLNKKMKKILEESNINYKSDKTIIEENVENLKKHMEKNKHDNTAKKAITKKLWRIQKLSR